MNRILEFFSKLLDGADWPARWHCGNWSSLHGWIYIISDGLIWISYFLIPVIIFNYVRQRRGDLKFSTVYILFALFILLCGTTHLIDLLMFWVPAYRLNTLVRFATAIASVATVYYLFKSLPTIFKEKTYAELLREIEQRKEAERKLAIANADLEKFAYVASHDLQEPLRKIILFSEMLEQRNIEHFDDRSIELINKIIRSSHRMQRLINDVLSLSKLNNDVVLGPVNMNATINSALEELELKIQERDATIIKDDLPEVMGNEGYLKQLFYNLIGNAIKFSTEKPEITIKGTTENGKAYISVADRGIGIDEEYFDKIFLPFQRLNGSSQFEGSGIGLSLVQKIVDIHGGKILVESKPGDGSRFIVELDLEKPAE